jgi:hypothetical protein
MKWGMISEQMFQQILALGEAWRVARGGSVKLRPKRLPILR